MLGLLARVLAVHQQQVAEDPEEHERDRGHHPLAGPRGERVERVRDHGRRRDDRDELVDEDERVAREHRPPGRLLGADEHELAAPLREREEEGQRPGTEQEPGRDRDVHRDRAGDGPDDEQARDRHHVDQHDVLEPERVRELERDECRAARAPTRARARPRSRTRRGRGRPPRRARPAARRGRSRSDGGAYRVEPVVLGIPHVVQEVRGRRGRAVGDEHGARLEQPSRVSQLAGEDDPGEDEEVLRPPPRSQRGEPGRRSRPDSGRGHAGRLRVLAGQARSASANAQDLWKACV